MSDYVKYSIAYFNTYSGKETVKLDAGMAGCITGYSRPKLEKTEPHEIYYYYRSQVAELNDINELGKRLKKDIKKILLKR